VQPWFLGGFKEWADGWAVCEVKTKGFIKTKSLGWIGFSKTKGFIKTKSLGWIGGRKDGWMSGRMGG
jgi:hypothetical protein